MSIFGKHDLLSIGHNVDLELTLPLLLGPIPWSLSTPDRISTKTDKSKLLSPPVQYFTDRSFVDLLCFCSVL